MSTMLYGISISKQQEETITGLWKAHLQWESRLRKEITLLRNENRNMETDFLSKQVR